MNNSVSRRYVLRVAASAPLLGTVGTSHAETLPRNPPADPIQLLQTYRKMRFALHDEPVYWWMRATKYGLVDSLLTPLYEMEIASIFKVVESNSDNFITKALEIVYATDAETGKLLKEWVNPYTGDALPMHHIPIGPNTMNYTVDGAELPTELPGATLEASREFGPIWFEADSVWLRDDTAARVTQADGKSKPFRVYDWPTYHSKRADVSDPASDSAPCGVSFTAVSDWQRWMGMQGRPGNLMTRGSGQKVANYDHLPARFRGLLEEVHPTIAANPEKALDLPPFRFER